MAVHLKPLLTLSDAQAQAIVDRAAPGRRLTRVSEMQMGEISAVFALVLDDDDGSPGLVLKVYPETLHWKMRKEVAVARLVEGRLSLPVPRIVLADESRALLDHSFLVMTRLKGSGLLAMEASLPPPALVSAYEQMGRAMREVHRIPMDAFGYIGPDGIVQPSDSNRAYMQAQFERKLAGFAQSGGDASLARRLQSYVADRLSLLDGCRAPCLCHYDFHTGNILAERHGEGIALTGLLDWENAVAGDPMRDLAKTFAYSVRGDATKEASLLAGYGPIERPHGRETVEFYEFYALIELWAWWTEIGDHQRASGMVAALQRYG